MSDVFDMFKKKSTSPAQSPDTVDVFDMFKKSAPTTVAAPVTNAPTQITVNPQPPISMPTPEEAKNLAPAPKPVRSALRQGYFPVAAAEATEAHGMISQGVDEIAKGQAATGAGNIAMGTLKGLASPVTPFFLDIQDVGNRIAPGLGDKLGIALPIKTTVAGISNKMPSNVAIKTIIDTIGEKNLPKVISELRSNPRLSLIDANDELLQMGQRLTVMPGKHRSGLWDFNKNRMDTTKDAVKGIFDENLGMTVDAKKRLDEMKAVARETGAKLINPVVEKSSPADITNVIKHIETEIGRDPVGKQTLKQLKAGEPISGPGMSDYQRKLFEARQDLRGDWTDKPQMFLDVKGEQGLHQKQMDLRREAQALLDSNEGDKRLLGKKLMDVRNMYVDAIDKAAPGYKAALSKYADDITIQEYFDKGFKLFSNSTKLENRPEFKIADMERIKKDLPEAFKAMQEGARVAIDSSTRSFRNSARKGEDLVQSEFNQELLTALYGKTDAQKAIKYLNDERRIANTDSLLYKNSQTARREEANQAVELPEAKPFGARMTPPIVAELGALGASQFITGAPIPGVGLAGFLGAASISKAGNVTNRKLAEKRNQEIVKILTATGEDRDALINLLSSYIPNKALPKTTQALQTMKRIALPFSPP